MVQIFKGPGFLGFSFFHCPAFSGSTSSVLLQVSEVALVGAEAVVRKCSVKKIFLKISRTPRKIPVFESHF